jgi:hypothetical protein
MDINVIGPQIFDVAFSLRTEQKNAESEIETNNNAHEENASRKASQHSLGS